MSTRAATLGLLFVVSPVAAFTQDHVWSGQYGSGLGTSIQTDPSGNVIVTGLSSSSVDFGGGPLVDSDMFLAKLDPEGRHLWSHGFKIESGVILTKTTLCIDTMGNVVVVGEFQGTVDFGGGSMTSTGGTDVFLAKFGPSGSHLWSQRFGGGADGRQMAWDITVDGADNLFVTGEFVHSIDFGGGPLEADFRDVFVTKFDAAGNHVWSRDFGDGGSTIGFGISVDSSGNVFITGEFNRSIDFGGGPLVAPGSQVDIFVLKLDSAGAHLWSKRFGDASFQAGMDISVDAMGNAIVVGDIRGTVDFGGGPIESAGNGSDSFAVKFDGDGNHQWSLGFGVAESGPNITPAVAVDDSSRVFLTGFFSGVTHFGGEPIVSAGGRDVFLAILAADGSHLWSQGFGDSNSQLGHSVATRGLESVVATGAFRGSIDFGGEDPLVANEDEIFVVKLLSPSRVSVTGSSLTAVKRLYR